MADNFGTKQDRVLTVSERNLDNVIFQKATPPLSSEWNLINQISNQKIQDLSKVLLPSGWLTVGSVYQDKDETLFVTGDVNCSFDYSANSFKICGTGNNIAVVNGWPILVKGTSSLDDNNIIYLPDPTTQVYDFVFLEVWRKLVAYNEQIYPYGNVLKTPVSLNEIKWDAIGIETTKRVQIQYKIRAVSINTILTTLNDVGHAGDVFTEVPVYPIGGSLSGEVTSYPYASFGASDGGLYRAGSGDSTSQTLLGTVDGYVYAIPMLLVYRRSQSVSPFTATTINVSCSTKATVDDGYATDRPDNKVADVIYKDDVVDFRHKIVTSNSEADQILNESLSKLIAGEFSTAVKYGFGADGAMTASSSGGSELMKVEQINASGSIPSIGTGSALTGSTFKRRAFCNAQMLHDHNIVEIPIPGATWTADYTFNAASVIGYPSGSLNTVDGFYTPSLTDPVITGIVQVGGPTSTTYKVTTAGVNSIVGTSARLLMEFTFQYDADSYGFKDVPKEFLEVRKGNYLQIATRDSGEDGVAVRYDDSQSLLQSSSDTVRYKGGNYTENSYFGHEMMVYSDAPLSTFTVSLTGGKYNNHFLLGVKTVETQDTPSSSWVSVTFNQQRNVTTVPYAITSYTVSLLTSGPSTRRARVVFYTGSGYINDVGDTYSLADSFKFFELSKQGRGVIDTYEMIDAIAVEEISSPGTYKIDTAASGVGDKPIISIAATFEDGAIDYFGFDSSNPSVLLTVNENTPVLDSSGYSTTVTPTMIKFQASAGLGKIRVPILVHSYVVSSEDPYSFFYKTIPYQGLLTASTNFYGKVEKEGPGLITSLGSGAVANLSYTGGHASVTTGSKVVTGVVDVDGNFPVWTQYVQPGDYFIKHSGTDTKEHIFTRYYKIAAVTNDTSIELTENFGGTASVSTEYEIIRMDVPADGIANIIDRLPAYKITVTSSSDVTDYRCASDLIEILDGGYSSTVFTTNPHVRSNDPLNAWVNDFKLGSASVSKRGRNDFQLSSGTNTAFKLSVTGQYPRPYLIYQSAFSTDNRKIAQVYLFQRSAKDMIGSESGLTGRLYLMIVVSEVTDTTDNKIKGMLTTDTVDVFELCGRPIIKV